MSADRVQFSYFGLLLPVVGVGRIDAEPCDAPERVTCALWSASGERKDIVPPELHLEGRSCGEVAGGHGFFFNARTKQEDEKSARAYYRSRSDWTLRDLGVSQPDEPAFVLSQPDGARRSAIVRGKKDQAWLVSLTHRQKCVRLAGDVHWATPPLVHWRNGIVYYQDATQSVLCARTIDARFSFERSLPFARGIFREDAFYYSEFEGGKMVLYRLGLPFYQPASTEDATAGDCTDDLPVVDAGTDTHRPDPPVEDASRADASAEPDPFAVTKPPARDAGKQPSDDATPSSDAGMITAVSVDGCTVGAVGAGASWPAWMGLFTIALRRRRRRALGAVTLNAGLLLGCSGTSEEVATGESEQVHADAEGGETISAGNHHTCALRLDGTIACWGGNDSGQSTPPDGSFRSLAAGSEHTCGVRTDGSVACWGSDEYGQATPPTGSFRMLSASGSYTCGVRGDGTVACWGKNHHGQALPPAGIFRSVNAGYFHTCGVKVDGTIACWGSRDQIEGTPAGSFRSVSAGYLHTCGVRLDRSVSCWGRYDYGAPSPPPSAPILSLSAGYSQTCGVKGDGDVACWGYTGFGRVPPAAGTFRSVSANYVHACGVKSDGTVACWGDNSWGQATPPAEVFR